ncbi:MAG: tetratricopeptide repeat protein [Acidobacteriota bacterium]|nr:tetratricopeptide repeat protein [Acidobacteriota bacterium]
MANPPELPEGARATAHSEITGSNNVNVQIVGDGNTVVAGYAHLTLTRYLTRRALPEGGQDSEAAQLSPYALAVPLVGREEVLEDQWRWMRRGLPVSIRVMTARAGAGKTRLALELCEAAVEAQWDAGFLTESELERFRRQQNLTTWGWSRPTLIVVDYAALRARLLRPWLIELANHPGREGMPPTPLRLLLLERHAEPSGGWWREAFGVGGGDAEAVERLLDPASGPYLLPGLAGPRERRAVLTSMLERIGSPVRPPEPGASPDFDRRLAELSWGGEPLFLLMAALVADKADFGEVLALSAPDLGFRIARHELGRLAGLAQVRQIPEAFFAHLAAYATLCQGLSRDEVEAVVAAEKEALGYHSAGDAPEVYEALAAALPGEPEAVAPVLPDVIGEAVVLEAFGCGSAEKALAAVSRVCRQAGGRVTASLIHLAQDYGEVREKPLQWLERVAGERKDNLESLKALLFQLPESTLALREFAADLTREALELAREQGSSQEELALLLNNLSVRLSDLGRWEEGLAAIEEAVAVYRALASSRPDAFRPDLARSLNNLSHHLNALGRREEGLAASEEAVAVYRALASSRPDAFRPDLAGSLNNLSNHLSALGRRKEGLAAVEEAVMIRRDLAASHPDAFRPDLAMSLNNLSNHLSDLRRREKGLVAMEEAVAVYRALAASHPDAFRPDLAMSLNNLSNRLSDLGRREEGLAAIEEAVVIRRALAASRPDAFRPDLASSLNNLSLRLSALGRREEGLAASEEAVRILAPYFLVSPAAFRSWMATMVRVYRQAAQEVGREPDRELLGHLLPLLEDPAGFSQESAPDPAD